MEMAFCRPRAILCVTKMLPVVVEESPGRADSIGIAPDLPVAELSGFENIQVSPARLRACVMRWNGQWIPGDRFARDFAAGVLQFDAEVSRAARRFLPGKTAAMHDQETHAATWAAVLVAFEAASFRDSDRQILQAAVFCELRPAWTRNDRSRRIRVSAVLCRAAEYFALRESGGQLVTADRMVTDYLASIGLANPKRFSALRDHLCAIFGYRMLRDTYRLSAASKLREAVSSLAEGRRLVQAPDAAPALSSRPPGLED